MEKLCIPGILFLSVHFFFSLSITAQTPTRFTGNYNNAQQFMEDVMGRPIYLKVEYNVEGSPFYPDEYLRANVYVRKGKIYTGIYVKFNLQENLVLYKQDDGTEMSAATPIKRVIFTDTSYDWIFYNTIFESGFPSIDNQNENTIYEVLDSGKVKLLKYHAVKFTDKKYYGQASMTRVFEQFELYYAYLPNGTIKKMEKGIEFFLSLFTDKKEEISKYIDTEKLKCRKESDWKKAIAYYNSLFSNSN